jgi:hypothetical protein
MINVAVEQTIVSNVPGRVGNWQLRRLLWFPAVPREGDWVAMDGDGEIQERVVRVTWPLHGPPELVLSKLETAESGTLDPYDALVADGWQRLGGPWPDQAGP